MSINFKTPQIPFLDKLKPIWRYRLVLFVAFVAALSGYLVMQINTAINVPPSAEVETATARKTPRIDPVVVQQLQSLQDNSVSVKALFNEARENPFQ